MTTIMYLLAAFALLGFVIYEDIKHHPESFPLIVIGSTGFLLNVIGEIKLHGLNYTSIPLLLVGILIAILLVKTVLKHKQS